jgi:uncharacterized FlaG/YvyC family protein
MGAAMDNISGQKPVNIVVSSQSAAVPASSGGAGQGAVPPVQKAEATDNNARREGKPSGGDIPRDQLTAALTQLESRMPVNVNFDITYDESIKREVVRGTSKLTGETVIEFPTEEMQKLIRGLRAELGLAVDENA